MIPTFRRGLLGLILTTFAVIGCGGSSAGVTVDGPYVRITGPDAPAAAYMVLVNGTDTADSLVSASSPAFGKVELHESVVAEASPAMPSDGSMDPMASMKPAASMGDMMGMRPVAEIPVPANGSQALKPGGYHVMLMEPVDPLAVGQTIELTLTFKSGGTVKVSAPVQGV